MQEPVQSDPATPGAPVTPPPLLATGGSTPPPPLPPSYPAYYGSSGPVAPTPRRGNGWRVVAFLLMVGLVISLVGNLVLGIGGGGGVASSGHGHHAGDHFVEAVLEDNDADDKILVVNVDGVISSQAVDPDGSTLVDVIHDQLDRASRDHHVKAVVLRVDSPGGEVLASDEIYRLIKKFQEGEDGKPVIATMGNVAASGGYYVSAPCRWIVANELTITGSIGVIMHGYNYRGLMDKVGVRRQVFKSGKFKDMMSPDKSPEEETAEEKAMVQGMIQETFERFKSVVAEGRKYASEQNKDEGRKLAADWESLADGRILSGKTAFEKGFVDELGNFDTAVMRALEVTKLSKANLVSYHLPFNFANMLRIFGKAETRGVKVDLGLDLPKALLPGRLYYLAPGMVH